MELFFKPLIEQHQNYVKQALTLHEKDKPLHKK